MANADFAHGFKAVQYLNGQPYTGAVITYNVPSGDGTALFVGDPVKLAGTATTVNGIIYADVIQAATGDRVVGVVEGFAVDPTNLESKYRLASTQRLVYCSPAEQLEYEVQEVSGGTPLTANDISLNANFVVGSGNTTTGFSGVELNNATEATGNTLDVQITAFVNRPDNEIGEHAKWLVRFNKLQHADQVAGI